MDTTKDLASTVAPTLAFGEAAGETTINIAGKKMTTQKGDPVIRINTVSTTYVIRDRETPEIKVPLIVPIEFRLGSRGFKVRGNCFNREEFDPATTMYTSRVVSFVVDEGGKEVTFVPIRYDNPQQVYAKAQLTPT